MPGPSSGWGVKDSDINYSLVSGLRDSCFISDSSCAPVPGPSPEPPAFLREGVVPVVRLGRPGR